MTTRMLIDAAHPEETRVIVQRGNRVEEFDFESANRLPLRGNIYLAKVTRVEPSLQAAFVDFGGNRHGFLAFSEIHPDYYQIPVADRQALLADEAAAARDEDEDEERGSRRRRDARPRRQRSDEKVTSGEISPEGKSVEGETSDAVEASEAPVAETAAPQSDENGEDEGRNSFAVPEPRDGEDQVEQLGGLGDAMEEMPVRAAPRHRKQYKIQEVIKRRQILLVQVVKEERGNKGAALTTYLSLAGRYSVLMPNTARGGGISRKITNATDRKRLKEMAAELEVPDGMGMILRTAGASRTKPEIKRDFEYLMRLWESVRTLTLDSTAPALVYEEGSLVKRAIRDLYNKDIEEVLVAGENGYREAKEFMRMLMPSHAKVVQPYKDPTPLFARYGVEAQLDAMFSNVVTLKSGGYIVINPTEALVSIDVNSGRSTREHNIEDTALKTNLEAAEEISRQLRLRDLAGLVVIDFIDMEENRNNKAVERKLNECLKNDRARIQVGRISHFGLLEMSRQRIRTGVLESSSVPCTHCGGGGLIRSTPSLALHVLRALEEQLLKGATHDLIVRTRIETALYILNQKRDALRALESRFGVNVAVLVDNTLAPGTHFTAERGEPAQPRMMAEAIPAETQREPVRDEKSARAIHPEDIEMEDAEVEEPAEDETESEATGETESRGEGEGTGRKRRRRRRRGGRGGDRDGVPRQQQDQKLEDSEDTSTDTDGASEDEGEDAPREGDTELESAEKRRRRRRRGGRRNRRGREERGLDGTNADGVNAETSEENAAIEPPVAAPDTVAVMPSEEAPAAAEAPAKPRRGRVKKADVVSAAEDMPVAIETAATSEEKPAKPARAPRGRKKAEPIDAVADAPAPAEAPAPAAPPAPAPVVPAPVVPAPVVAAAPKPAPEPEVEDPNRPKRSGWWSRAKQALGG